MTNAPLNRLPSPFGPDFVGVGVQKAGTSWAGYVLAQHPGLFINKKEISFFVRFYHKGYSWYHAWFEDKNGRLAGEFTQSYIISPRPDPEHREFYPNWNPRRRIFFWREQPSARDELKAHYPDVRVFAMFRNPVDRAWSAYWFWRRRKERIGKRFVEFEKMWADDGRWIKTGDYTLTSSPIGVRHFLISACSSTMISRPILSAWLNRCSVSSVLTTCSFRKAWSAR